MITDNTSNDDNDNYQVWKYKVELLLLKEDLWSVVDEELPEVPNAAWIQKDKLVQQLDCSSRTISSCTFGIKLLRDTWNALKTYHQKVTLTNKVYLLKRICNLKLTDDMF